jgi:3-isopropylmalate dehydratase large subunit
VYVPTVVEKIFSNHTGATVKAGDIVIVEVDASFVQDMNGPSVIKEFESFAKTVKSPHKHLFSLDHFSPSCSVLSANNHREIRDFLHKHGISRLVEEGDGIGHQRMVETGLAGPGAIIVGTDSHCCHYGVVNCFSTGIGATEEAVVLASDMCWFRVPGTIRVEFHGKPKPQVTSKDMILTLVDMLTQDGAIYQTLEFGGDTLDDIGIDDRAVICNMAVEAGAKGAIMPCDRVLRQWLREQTASGTDCPSMEGIVPDADAVYTRRVDIDAAGITPCVAVPPDIDHVVPVDSLGKQDVHIVVIGGCTNGRYSDFVQAAAILRGKKIAKGLRLVIAPASRGIVRKMLDTGVYEDLFSAGATILPPGCGPCSGITGGLAADGEVVFATANRNMTGRMGSQKSRIFIGSPITAAYSAMAGYITTG